MSNDLCFLPTCTSPLTYLNAQECFGGVPFSQDTSPWLDLIPFSLALLSWTLAFEWWADSLSQGQKKRRTAIWFPYFTVEGTEAQSWGVACLRYRVEDGIGPFGLALGHMVFPCLGWSKEVDRWWPDILCPVFWPLGTLPLRWSLSLPPRAVERLPTDLGVDSERHLSPQRDKRWLTLQPNVSDCGLGTQV